MNFNTAINLNTNDREYISCPDFFEDFIRSGAIFKETNAFLFPNHYIQKTNGSFRSTKLVPPLIYLYLESLGLQISKQYKREESTVRCYYAGDFNNNEFHYKKSYDKFFADINES